jgi:hypothetical protein
VDFEALYEELARGPEIFRALLLGVTQAEAQSRPAPEAWSILEVVCHLYDEEINDFRPRLDVILHRPNDAFAPNNPQEWITERKYNERDLAEMFELFAAERTRSLNWLRGLSDANWEAAYDTPWGRHMTAGDMFASWVAHDNLHTRQLVELRRARIERMTAPYILEYAGDW